MGDFEGDISEYWRLSDELTVRQAALLLVGVDPSSETGCDCERMAKRVRPPGYEAAKQAVAMALRKGAIAGIHVPSLDHDPIGNAYAVLEGSTDTENSTVERDSLVDWLADRGVRSGFFFPDGANVEPDFLDRSNPRYAPKLAAAVEAWRAVTESGKKSPKQALEKWLREHAADFGLTDEDGNPVSAAIEECSKVANWNTKGGAPKTPTA